MAHKLLLADDSVTIQRVIELTFADEDVQVLTAGDGQQAIARIEADRPDVVLADVGMPERDGYEVAAYVKSHEHLKHIPVVLLTGAFEPVDEQRAHAIGCEGVLVKPFEPQMVINRVKDLLAGRRPQPPGVAAPGAPTGEAARLAPAAGRGAPERGDVVPAAETVRSATAESLDEYFDRLDAAFANLGTEGKAAAAPSAGPVVSERGTRPDRLASFDRFDDLSAPPAGDDSFAMRVDQWDPSLSDDEAEPVAQSRASAPVATAPPAGMVPPATAATPGATIPSLSDAFAALLAAEQTQMVAGPREAAVPPPVTVAPAPVITDDVIETIVERVIQRLGTIDVRDTVLQAAERLVRDEIDRIKSAAH